MTSGLRERALRLLARREHSRAELARKLATEPSADAEAIEEILDRLERDGYLSDERFAEAFVASRSARHGARRLRHDLRSRGVSDPHIDRALDTLTTTDLERARALWQRRFGRLPENAREYARQARYLEAHGFAPAVLRALIRTPGE